MQFSRTTKRALAIAACVFANASANSASEAADGSVVAWGCGVPGWDYGQCDVPAPNTDFVAVAGGEYHSLGLKANGSIVAWGWNGHGQCDVPEPNTDFVGVAAGDAHSLGLKADGSIVAWGWNYSGQCDVPAPNTDFVGVAQGAYHSLGLKADGSIVAWGSNSWGQCNLPVPNTGFVAVAGGHSHGLALKADGSIVPWGDNEFGQCSVPAPNADFVAVATCVFHSLGLKADGSVVAWGSNINGECNVPTPNTDFVAVAAGAWFSLALKTNGSIVAWGSNGYGQCNVPVPNADFMEVAAGGYHSLGLRGARCGDDVVDEGEQCEPPGSDCCDDSCHFELDGIPCPNDFYCDGDERCQSGACVDGPDPCVDLGHCDEGRDRCLSCIDDTECRDDDPCTEDACILNICVHTTIPGCQVCLSGDECEDGNPCTDDVCLREGDLPGICVRTNLIPGAPCSDDGNPCTDDVCDGAGACEHPSDDTNDCDDNEFCNGEATCQSGECVDGPDPCIDPDHCDEINDVCFVCVDDDECDDDDPCTDDACIDQKCVHAPRPGCDALAYLDIKPGSCRNPVNPRSKGVVPVAIIGSGSFDVTQIDIDSLVLARADGVGGVVTPLGKRDGTWSEVADVGTPFDGEPCDCHELGADGIDDVLLKFSTPELAEVLQLGSLPRGASVALTLGGSLFDGTGFEASDCIVIPGKD